MTLNLDFFFSPQSVVLYGISRKQGKSGYFIATNMKSYNPQHLFVIHPKVEEVHGILCKKKLADLPKEIQNNIDLAIISLPIPHTTEAVIECIQHQVKGIIIGSGNIGLNQQEVKQKTYKIQKALKQQKGQKTRIIGPNGLGVFNNKNKFFTAIMTMDKYPPFGENSVSIIGQTGLMVSGFLIDFLERKDISISKIFAIGNKLDINESDILEILLQDSNSKVIAMYLESIVDGPRFFDLCKRAIFEKDKIVILLKPGKSDFAKNAIMSHTQSIAGNSEIIRGMCSQLGIIQVDDLQEFIQACKLAANISLPQGNSIGLISISGAGCVLLADLAEEYNFHIKDISSSNTIMEKLREIFPDWAEISHPLDIWASIEQHRLKSYNIVLESFLESGLFDVIIMCNIGGKRTGVDFEYIRNLRIKFPEIPIIIQLFGGLEEKKRIFSEEFEVVNSSFYIPIVYDLRRTMKILSQMIQMKKKLTRIDGYKSD
jgi:acyl-CoA synthetase (NDP forming)